MATIASETLWAQRPGEDAFEVCIEIGTPYLFADNPQEWVCPAGLSPLHQESLEAHGNSSFQSLCLASALLLNLLQEFKNQGGALFYYPGADFPLEAYSFGIAICNSASPADTKNDD